MGRLLVIAILLAGCSREEHEEPLGPRLPTVQCELTAPEGLARSPSPMPDHIAELIAPSDLGKQVIVSERPEKDVASAATQLRAHYGQATELPLENGGRILSTSQERVVLVQIPNGPVVEVLGRKLSAEDLTKTAQSMTCSR